MNIHTNLTRPYWIVKKTDGTYIDKGEIVQGQNLSTIRLIIPYAIKQDWLDILEDLGIDTTDL